MRTDLNKGGSAFQGQGLGCTVSLAVERSYLKSFCFLTLLLAGWVGIVEAASLGFLPQDMTVRAWSKQQGLPDNSVTAVLQTRDGYLWIGTPSGLVRFDGVRFVSVAPALSGTNELFHITALCEDSTGRLWVGTQGGGLLSYSGGTITRFQAAGDPLDDTINGVAEDAMGDIWLGTPAGLNRISTNRVTRFTSKEGLPSDFVSSVHVARSGTVWITTRGGMCQFKSGRLSPFPFQMDSPGRNPESLGVYEDRTGNLWAFGDTYLVNLAAGKHLNHFGGGETISTMRIWSLCEGRRGDLWIGTSGKGLFRFVDEMFIPITLRDNSIASDVRTIYEDREGNLWLGTFGSGLVRLQPSNVRQLNAGIGLPNTPPVCLALSPSGRVWVGLEHGGLFSGTAERFDRFTDELSVGFENLISSLCVGADGSVWVGTLGDGLYRVMSQGVIHYGTVDGLSDNSIVSLASETNGVVWIGTHSGALNRIEVSGKVKRFGKADGFGEQAITAILPASNGSIWLGFADGGVVHGRSGEFNHVVHPAAVSEKSISALHEDIEGRIWFGTAGGQLACVAAGRVLNWELNLGAAKESILGLQTDGQGDLWLGTTKAIYHVPKREVSAVLSGQGIIHPQLVFESDIASHPAMANGWPRAAKAVDGKLWFGLASGVVTVDPARPMTDSSPMPVVIEELIVNGNAFPHASVTTLANATNQGATSVRLPSGLRSLEIQFAALNFSAPERIRFRHRLDGFDPDWVDGGEVRSVNYGRLPYGSYTFRVQAGNAEAWFDSVAAVKFMIPTPFWRTGWALGIYVVAVIVLVAGAARMAFNRRLRRRLAVLADQQAMERERMRIAQDMHDEIGSKLTKISFMSERAIGELEGQKSVATKLDSIAHTSRDLLQSLDEIVWAVNPHNDTLEHLAAYLGHYATEYLQNTSVDCELHIPQALPHHPLAAEIRHNLFLAFEESLNNALKHGKASRIRVRMQTDAKRFEIRIEDNGCGFDAASTVAASRIPSLQTKRGGNGLRNIQQRLSVVGGRCEIQSESGQGTVVILSVPLLSHKTRTKGTRP